MMKMTSDGAVLGGRWGNLEPFESKGSIGCDGKRGLHLQPDTEEILFWLRLMCLGREG